MKKIPTNSFKIIRIISIIFIVLGLVPTTIMLSVSIAALLNDGFTTVFIFALVVTIVLFLLIVLPYYIIKGLCETGISFSDHISRQTKILEEINKKLDKSDNEKTQKTSKQTKTLEETDKKLDNEKMQENSRQTKTLEETNEKSDNEETQE